MVCH
jgi:hypothetical protein